MCRWPSLLVISPSLRKQPSLLVIFQSLCKQLSLLVFFPSLCKQPSLLVILQGQSWMLQLCNSRLLGPVSTFHHIYIFESKTALLYSRTLQRRFTWALRLPCNLDIGVLHYIRTFELSFVLNLVLFQFDAL